MRYFVILLKKFRPFCKEKRWLCFTSKPIIVIIMIIISVVGSVIVNRFKIVINIHNIIVVINILNSEAISR